MAREMSKKQRDRYQANGLPQSTTNPNNHDCPPHDFTHTKDIGYVARQLGITERQLGMAVHKYKRSIEDNPDVMFCVKCGDIAIGDSVIGNLLE